MCSPFFFIHFIHNMPAIGKEGEFQKNKMNYYRKKPLQAKKKDSFSYVKPWINYQASKLNPSFILKAIDQGLQTWFLGYTWSLILFITLVNQKILFELQLSYICNGKKNNICLSVCLELVLCYFAYKNLQQYTSTYSFLFFIILVIHLTSTYFINPMMHF